jgi:hypothetical protein
MKNNISKDLAMTLWGYRQTTFHEKSMRRLNRVARMNNVEWNQWRPWVHRTNVIRLLG